MAKRNALAMPSRIDPTAAKHLVLIHGAWQGSWAFDAWRPYLEADGWTVHAVDLPGSAHSPQQEASPGLRTYVAHVCEVIRPLAGPIVVLGHSGGGITATQVAEELAERLSGVVYLAGMMLPSRWTYRDVLRACEGEQPGRDFSGIAPHLVWNEARSASRVPPEAALEIFLHDCEAQAAQRAASLLCAQPESGRAMHPVWTPQRAGKVRRAYVECTQDRSVALTLQRKMQALTPGAVRITLDCGHVPQLAAPAELSARLLPLLDGWVAADAALARDAA